MAGPRLTDVTSPYGAPMGRPTYRRMLGETADWSRCRWCAGLIWRQPPSEVVGGRWATSDTTRVCAQAPRLGGKHEPEPIRLQLNRVRLNAGGYDAGGAYWGTGAPLYQYRNGDQAVEGYVRAADRAHAKAQIRAKFPDPTFYR